MKVGKTDDIRQYRMSRTTAPNALLRAGAITMVLLCMAAFVCGTAAAETIYVPDNQGTIQAAVTAAGAGDTVIVRDGTYNENVDVNTAHLTIRSENGSANCIVNAADPTDHVFDVQQDYVNISGFTATGATGGGWDWIAGICLYSVQHCKISENNCSENSLFGIYLRDSSNNTLTSNTANSNDWGIYLHHSGSNTFTSNTANSNTKYGIEVCHSGSNNNTFTSNTVNENNEQGIRLSDADDNNISCNWVQANGQSGFRLSGGSTGNTIEDNNIITNGVVQGDGSYQWQFYNNQDDAVDAKNNYWGTNDDNTIDASIFDNEEGKGTVTFLPKLDGASPCAPVPELPTILLLAVGLLMLAGYVRVGRRK